MKLLVIAFCIVALSLGLFSELGGGIPTLISNRRGQEKTNPNRNTVDLLCTEDGRVIPSTFWNGTTRLSSILSAIHTHVLTPDTEAGLSCRNEAGVLSNERRLAALPQELYLQDEPPRNQHIQRGQTVELPCDYRPGNLRELYEVFWGVREHGSDVDVVYQPTAFPFGDLLFINEDTFALTVAVNRLEQTGDQFHCIVDVRLNNIGSGEFRYYGATNELRVEEPAEIVEDVQDVTVIMGETASFTCGVIGTNLILSWEIDSLSYTGCDEPSFCVTNARESDSLMVRSTFEVDTEVAGLDNNTEVVCKASQMDGREVSSTARLIFQGIFVRVKVIEDVSAVVILEGDAAHFQCVFEGRPTPSTKWRLDGTEVQSFDRFSVHDNSGISGRLTSTLNITSAMSLDNGVVECEATNENSLENFTAISSTSLSVLPNDFDSKVMIPTEGVAQLQLTLPALIPAHVRVNIWYHDVDGGSVEERLTNKVFVNTTVILYEDTMVPYQKFRVQVALVVGNITGHAVPSSLENAEIYACPDGFYKPNATCVPCPPHTVTINNTCECRRGFLKSDSTQYCDQCTLDYLPVVSNEGELEACLPCLVGSTRMSQNDTECRQCKLQYFPVEGNFRCRVCPPGSERPDQSYASCVCKLLYWPVIQDNNLLSCIRCPAGSSRLSHEDLNCTCDLPYYPVIQNDELVECRPCPVGSSRLNHSVSECTCQLQLYPVPSPEDGMLQECHPCPINSARQNPADSMCTCNGNTVTETGNRNTITEIEICNICPLQYTVVANSTASLYLCEPCRPPGSRRLSHADENCTCGLEYYPVVQNGALQACNRCPAGSSRLNFSDAECTCNRDYFDSTVSQGLQCQRCPAGSSRNRNAIKCKCHPDLLSSGDDNFSLRCLPCPINSEKITADDRECTCSRNTFTMNGSTATTLDACILPLPAHTTITLSPQPTVIKEPTKSRGQGLTTTIIVITIPCVVVGMFVVIACIVKQKWNKKPKAYMEEVDLNFQPVSVSRSIAVSESVTTELCNLDFEKKQCELSLTVNRDSCTSDVRETDQEIIGKNLLPHSEMRLGNKLVSQADASEDCNKEVSSVKNNPKKPVEIGCLESNNQVCNCYEHAGNPNYDQTQRYELAGSAYDPTQRYELAGSAYDRTQRYELAGSAYDQTQRYELAGTAYDRTQRYELAGSAYDQTQRYELAGIAYDRTQRYELAGSAYDQIQSYEQLGSEIQQSSASPSYHDSDVARSSNTNISPGDCNKHTDIDATENIHKKVRSKEKTEPNADAYRETANSHSQKEDSDICEQVQEISSCGDDDQVQSYEQIASSYGQIQSYQQAHSAYDVIQDYSQVPYYEQTSNPYDQTQDYETVCAYESFHGKPVDSDAV